ncbi:MAG: hypothetical protein ABIM21_00665 [candidate division WOR-3 bacterium]
MRSFLILFLFLSFLSCDRKQEVQKGMEHSNKNYWKGTYFQQKVVKMLDYERWIVKAKAEGKWRTFEIVDLPENFINWSVERRLETLDKVRKNEMPSLSGPHNGMVASYGVRRKDSQFKINNAVKGMGFLPRKDKVKELIGILESTKDSSFEYKIGVLEKLYKNVDEYFTRKGLVSLELYSTPEFETHTFLNQMENPLVSIVFLDIPSFEVRALARMVHPEDPDLDEYERDVCKYANLVHSYFHGDFPKDFIGVIYYVIEVFDNTPGRGGKGKRVVPVLP